MRYARVPESICRDRRISHAQFRVLVCLLSYADTGGYCIPSVGTIARDLARSRATIRHHINSLVKLGYIAKTPRPRKDGSHASNLYCVARLCVVRGADERALSDPGQPGARAGNQQPAPRTRPPSLLMPLDGGRRRAEPRANRKIFPPVRQRRAVLSLSVATALAEMEGWGKS